MPTVPWETTRNWALVTFLFVILITNNDAPALITGHFSGASRLSRLREHHKILDSSKWGDFSPHAPEAGAPPWQAPKHLNLTGFREPDHYAWEDLAPFRDRCRQWSRHAYPPPKGAPDWEHGPVRRTWQNATGTVHGRWVRRAGSVVRHPKDYNLTAIAPGVDWADPDVEWGWNVTGSHGTILLRLVESADGVVYEDKETQKEAKYPHSGSLAREIIAIADIQDEDQPSPSFALRLHGVHWPRQGSILLTTTTDKFAGIFGLPHFAPAPEFYRTAKMLLNRTLDEVLTEKERVRFGDPGNPWTPVVEEESSVPWPRCEYIMYLQLHPLEPTYIGEDESDPQLATLIDHLENELRFPTGAPSKGKPDLRMSMVAWSPDCAYYLESKGPPLFPSVEGQHLVGLKSEVLLSRTKMWMFGFAAVLMAQLWLLKMQMKESNTPSTLGRISFHTAAMMLLADGLVFTCSSAWSLSATNTFLPSLILTFAAFMSMSIGAGFLSEIYKHQEPERRRNEARANAAAARAAPPSASSSAPAPAPAQSSAPRDSLPLPVTAPRRPASPPIIIPSDQDIDAEIAENAAQSAAAAAAAGSPSAPRVSTFASVTGTFMLLGIAVLILTAMSLSWPPRARAIYLNIVSFTYLSFWAPQIRRNVWRNSRRAFAWRFVLGQSVLRLLPFAYFYLRSDNILFVEPDPATFLALVAWVWVQVLVLAAQDVLGPRYGLPERWMPEVWEYHPVLREDNVEAGGLPIGLVSSGGLSEDHKGAGEEDSSPESSPVAPSAHAAARRGSWSLTSPFLADDGSWGRGGGGGVVGGRREREKELRRHGMALRTIDCAICTEVLEVPVVRADAKDPAAAGGLVGVFARRAYMVTPCRHIFHTKCLEGWFRYKLQCPICREELPPL
ncbi:hypothetical protein VTJ83DRAFT_5742 [Remersonia thermophila]|uniref:RING-type E3 ubiquitin transferase n=1 Tax=Remersonia thermophila TaxID=72144 RepID=A0ABR4D7U3_9PEZI